MESGQSTGLSLRDLIALESFKLRLKHQLENRIVHDDDLYDYAYEDAARMLESRISD